MTESTISLAKQPDGKFTYSLKAFDPKVVGDVIAYPRVNQAQLQALQMGTPDQVQRVLASLTNL